jgi:hypothetical protein
MNRPAPQWRSLVFNFLSKRETMKRKRQRLGLICLDFACLGLVPLTSNSAEQPKLRKKLKDNKGIVGFVAFSPDGALHFFSRLHIDSGGCT